MSAPPCLRAWAAAGALLTSTSASAQSIETLKLSGAPAISGGSRSSKTSNRIVMPTGHLQVGAEMALVTSDPWLTSEPLRFTDLALFRTHVRRSFADWLDLSIGASLLVKQPSTTDELIWQGGALGAQAEFAPTFAASLGFGMGPLLDTSGFYYQGGPALLYKPAVGNYLRFVLGLGNEWTFLDYDGQAPTFWLGELGSKAEVQAGDENASMWVGLDYFIPFASKPDSSAADPTHGHLDPQIRLNVEVGGALSLRTDGWNVFAAYRFIDRGELERPATTLPILDGGFDQQQAMVGIEYRFLPKKRRPENDWD